MRDDFGFLQNNIFLLIFIVYYNEYERLAYICYNLKRGFGAKSHRD